nr:hypothetical protein HmN_000575500 [Hymenolepis microstoma]
MYPTALMRVSQQIDAADVVVCILQWYDGWFCRESSTSDSMKQNPNNERALPQVSQSYDMLIQVNVNSRNYVNLSTDGIPFELKVDIPPVLYASGDAA